MTISALNNKNALTIGLALIFIYLLLSAYFRFTHQDVGWYYAYADRLAAKFSLNNSHSTWSFIDANGDNGAGGIIYILLQAVAIVIGGNDLLAVKILAGLIAFSTYLAFLRLLRDKLRIEHYFIFSLLLVIDPLFTFQVMNRPEMLASCIGLVIWNMGLRQTPSPWKFFWISFLTVLLLDIHPISLYLVVGFNLMLFFQHYRKILYFVGGLFSAFIIITGLNYALTGSYGILAIFGNTKLYMNDHYFPLFTDPPSIIITRPFIKLKYFIVYSLFGILLYYIIRYFKPLKETIMSRYEYSMLFLNGLIFFFISNLFSEGGNGYHLYSLIVYLPLFLILYNEILKRLSETARLVFIGFLMIIPLVALYKTIPRLNQWRKNSTYFHQNYMKINDVVKDGERLLVRPSFSFALSKRNVTCEPVYPILINMYNYNRDFPNAILAKNFDIIGVDEMFLHDADINTPVDKFSNGIFYKAVQKVKFDTRIIADMAAKNVLIPVMNYNDFYHGATTFYRVNKEALKTYCEEIR